jgi:hypothetical protein
LAPATPRRIKGCPALHPTNSAASRPRPMAMGFLLLVPGSLVLLLRRASANSARLICTAHALHPPAAGSWLQYVVCLYGWPPAIFLACSCSRAHPCAPWFSSRTTVPVPVRTLLFARSAVQEEATVPSSSILYRFGYGCFKTQSRNTIVPNLSLIPSKKPDHHQSETSVRLVGLLDFHSNISLLSIGKLNWRRVWLVCWALFHLAKQGC